MTYKDRILMILQHLYNTWTIVLSAAVYISSRNHDSRMIDKLESLTFGFTYIDELIELRERGPLPLKRNKTKTPIGKLRKPEWYNTTENIKINNLIIIVKLLMHCTI